MYFFNPLSSFSAASMCLGCRAIYQELGSLSRVTSFKKTPSQQPPTANSFSANMKLEGNSGGEGNEREGKGRNKETDLVKAYYMHA